MNCSKLWNIYVLTFCILNIHWLWNCYMCKDSYHSLIDTKVLCCTCKLHIFYILECTYEYLRGKRAFFWVKWSFIGYETVICARTLIIHWLTQKFYAVLANSTYSIYLNVHMNTLEGKGHFLSKMKFKHFCILDLKRYSSFKIHQKLNFVKFGACALFALRYSYFISEYDTCIQIQYIHGK